MRGRRGVEYLVDTSALYPLVLRLRERLLDYSRVLGVLDLTVYEVGNVIWKEHRRGRIRDPLAAARLFQEVFGALKVISLGVEVGGVLELAVREGLTFYDASYLYTARVLGVRLVTEDRELLRFPEAINTAELLRKLGAEGGGA